MKWNEILHFFPMSGSLSKKELDSKLAFSISLKIISRGVQPNCGLDSPTQTIWAELMSAGLCPLENDTVELVFMKTQSLPISKSHCSLINGKNS